MQDRSQVDLLVIGGGVNGAGIARDAAGRGLSVLLCEQDDLASGTSSASESENPWIIALKVRPTLAMASGSAATFVSASTCIVVI